MPAYKKSLFTHGIKSFQPYKKYSQSYGGTGKCGMGMTSRLDDQLLSLVKGASRINLKGARTKARTGKGLRLVR